MAVPCDHRNVEAFVLSKNYMRHKDGTTTSLKDAVMWACAVCKVRFYPACPTCIDVAHRNIVHPPGFHSVQER
jgi:hypothetical protein